MSRRKRIRLSLWAAACLLAQALTPYAQQPAPGATAVQEGAGRERGRLSLSLLEMGRGEELKALLEAVFGEEAGAAAGVLDEEPVQLFGAVGGAAADRSAESQEEEIKQRREGPRPAPAAPRPNGAPPRGATKGRAVGRAPAPRLDWRQFAFGFQPLAPQSPEVKVTQTDKEVSAEGSDRKSFETDKASLTRTQKAETKFVKDGRVFGVEIKHTEVIEAKAKADGRGFRKETVMFWRAEVAACPDARGVTAGTGRGSVTAKTLVGVEGGALTLTRDVVVQTKTTGHVDDEAEMTHYDLQAEATVTQSGYGEAAARNVVQDAKLRDGVTRLSYEMAGNQIEINRTAEGGPRVPAKMGKITVRMTPGTPPEDVKSADKPAGALVAGVWNHTNDMYKAARSHWRNYGCVEVACQAPKTRLKKGERLALTAETLHKQDGGKVNARLSAGALDAEVTPEEQAGTPSARYTFTHGGAGESHFTVESFSRRGIGIGGLDFTTEESCAGGFGGRIEVAYRRAEGYTKVTNKGEHISDQYYSGKEEHKSTFDYRAVFDVRDAPAEVYEDGTVSVTLKGAVTADAARVTEDRDDWTTTTDCFPDPPRAAGRSASSTISEIGKLSGAIDDGVLQIEGQQFRVSFGIPEIGATRRHVTSIRPFGWCMADANPPEDSEDESEVSFSAEAVRFEGRLDPKSPNVIEGSKTFTDELGNEVTIRWRLTRCA